MTKKIDLQMFAAETNLTAAADLEPAVSIDLTSRMSENISTLLRVISANEMIPMAVGTTIKMYETKVKTKPTTAAAEGEVIGLTKIERKLKNTFEIALSKYRKATSAEAIQKIGRTTAVDQTDQVLIKSIQKDIKDSFFTLLGTGTGTATAVATGLQAAMAAAWGAVQKKFDDVDATPIYFISTDDAAKYLATAQVTMQTAFGMSYIENFLGMGDTFITPSLTAGTVVATAKENLFCAYIPTSNGEVANTFGLTSDQTGLVGMTHSLATDRATVDTLVMSGVKFFPEDLSAVIKVAVTADTTKTE
ncbi:hypothetical protein [Faecalibaculum rodentium]|uniref:hypothetical protein n=1 Tax=Faecalibaculum rodentium TaxID=1702221 RepID=UPI0025A5D497|nr:hypothetical protein [Faecalibaculum rodentium]